MLRQAIITIFINDLNMKLLKLSWLNLADSSKQAGLEELTHYTAQSFRLSDKHMIYHLTLPQWLGYENIAQLAQLSMTMDLSIYL